MRVKFNVKLISVSPLSQIVLIPRNHKEEVVVIDNNITMMMAEGKEGIISSWCI
jgi:hypothetical protein